MKQTKNQTSGSQTQTPPPPELIRPVNGRIIAGVAQGVANRFNLPVWLVRIAFVVLAFTGGVGIALYAAGWALLRAENEADTPAERFFRDDRSPLSWIGVGLVVLAGLILLGNFTFLSGEVLVALGLMAIGIFLYTGRYPRAEASDTQIPEEVAEGPESKEGVQPMTTTQTPERVNTPSGDSPAGGDTAPPPTPTPTPPDLPPAAPREQSFLGRLTIGLMLLGLGVLAILDNIDSVPIDADPRHYLALAVVILGVGLLVGSVLGRARWLIILGAILVPTLLFSPAFEYDWTNDTFDQFVAPTSFIDIEPEYSVDVGNLVIDLTDLDWDGETVELRANVDAGNLEVRVPADVGLEGMASVDIGRVAGPGSESFGFGDPSVTFDRPGEAGLIVLDLTVDVGNIEVDVRR